ncbi:Protein BREAKING OF ASYMMETRY IN THE STOMATAL LINEAGE [Raphanus sativus]|nr:Protein BREAKING OF ASYMMETRY IN THE STOMATAL LINEAGE [Raphanus sativus]
MNSNNVMFKRTKRKMKSKKKRSERKLSLSPPGTRHHHLRSSSVSPTSASQNRRLSWQQQQSLASDEPGFIVFCFDREDGGFDVVKEGKEERKEVELSSEKLPRTVNRKLIYGDQGEVKTEKVNSPEIKEPEQDQTIRPNCKKLKMFHVMFMIRRMRKKKLMPLINLAGLVIQTKEGDRLHFPYWELSGWSPVQMPKTDDLSPEKQKPIALGFQCCRF